MNIATLPELLFDHTGGFSKQPSCFNWNAGSNFNQSFETQGILIKTGINLSVSLLRLGAPSTQSPTRLRFTLFAFPLVDCVIIR